MGYIIGFAAYPSEIWVFSTSRLCMPGCPSTSCMCHGSPEGNAVEAIACGRGAVSHLDIVGFLGTVVFLCRRVAELRPI